MTEESWFGSLFQIKTGPSSLELNGYEDFPRGQSERNVKLTVHPSNAEVRNKFSYASTPPYALQACPFTFIFTTKDQIGRYFLINSKCSNLHPITQALLSNPALQTANLMDTPPFINNCSSFTSVALIRASLLEVEYSNGG